MTFRAGNARYFGRILRPTKSPSSGGREGQAEIVQKQWWFQNVDDGRRGHEVEVARQMNPLVTHVLKGWNPGVPVLQNDYVEWEGRRLNIDFADPHQENGAVLKLVCIEQAK
jgi:hypothetical protein